MDNQINPSQSIYTVKGENRQVGRGLRFVTAAEQTDEPIRSTSERSTLHSRAKTRVKRVTKRIKKPRKKSPRKKIKKPVKRGKTRVTKRKR